MALLAMGPVGKQRRDPRGIEGPAEVMRRVVPNAAIQPQEPLLFERLTGKFARERKAIPQPTTRVVRTVTTSDRT